MSRTEDLWTASPWQAFPPADAASPSSGQRLGWHKHLVPYKSRANKLQNLEIWIPAKSDKPPEVTSSFRGNWVVYIHGGAWRDPLVSSTAFAATVQHILESHQSSLSKIAGFASLNYTLSPYPNHPTHASPPRDASQQPDPSRTGKHPDHIVDVLSGLAFLQRQIGFGSSYILLGHSCGATLAFQALMDPARWDPKHPAEINIAKPLALISLNGIHDLPRLIKAPGTSHANLVPVYGAFTRGAFGDDETAWIDVSPISFQDLAREWGVRDAKVVLVQSKEDSLVPYHQLEDMMNMLKASKSANLQVTEMVASGDHNDLWKKGDRLAEIVVAVADSCFK